MWRSVACNQSVDDEEAEKRSACRCNCILFFVVLHACCDRVNSVDVGFVQGRRVSVVQEGRMLLMVLRVLNALFVYSFDGALCCCCRTKRMPWSGMSFCE